MELKKGLRTLRALPAFGAHVGQIVGGRALEQVQGVNALAIVAVVADVVPVLWLADEVHPLQPVSRHGVDLAVQHQANQPVAVGVEGSGPFPAAAWSDRVAGQDLGQRLARFA